MRKRIALLAAAALFCVMLPQGDFASSKDTITKQIEQSVSSMSIDEKIGQMLMISVPSMRLDSSTKKLIQDCHIGSVILYKNNISSIDQTIKLTSDLQSAAGNIPLLIATDHEGGRVSKLAFGTELPGNMALGATKSTDLAYETGKLIGEEIGALGINTALAPVLDVNTNPDNPVIGLRSFGSEPKLVADMGAAEIKGLQATEVAVCAKHFPGHGDTSVDSHLELPVLKHDLKRLESVELLPFKEAIGSGVDMIMTAHIAVPALDSTTVSSKKTGKKIYLPATLSKKILTGLLKGKLGFKGCVLTDSMHMKAITENFGDYGETAVMAVNAGSDIVMVQVDIQDTYDWLISEVKKGNIKQTRLNDAVTRVIKLKLKLGLLVSKDNMISGAAPRTETGKVNPREIINSHEHRGVADAICENSVKVIINEGIKLPVSYSKDAGILIMSPGNDILKKAQDSVIKVNSKLQGSMITAINYLAKRQPDAEMKKLMDSADLVLLFTCSYTKEDRNPAINSRAAFASVTAEYCRNSKRPLTVIAVGDPNDADYLQNTSSYIITYSNSSSSIQAAVRRALGN